MGMFDALQIVRANVNGAFRTRDQFDMIVLVSIAFYVYRRARKFFRLLETESLADLLKEYMMPMLRLLPSVRAKLDEAVNDTTEAIQHSIKRHRIRRFEQLPKSGRDSQEVIDMITKDYAKEKEITSSGKLSGTVYHGGQDLAEMFGHLFTLFAISNPLHADVFFHSRQLEAEVIRMVADMYNGDSETCGVMTYGGTESITMSIKAYRDRGRVRGITEPNICIPVSAHAAFLKAGQYFNVAVKLVPLDPVTSQVCVKSMRRAINSRTVAIVGSCPGFPHGTIDPIEDLARLAQEWNIGMHVDACLGGFVVPFMEEVGYKMPRFDFRVPGVTTISCDVHKYGFAPKGTSVLLYRNKEWRKHQYSFMPKWQGGIYATPGLAGSRAGALAVMSWAAMVKMGRDGYAKATRIMVEAAREVAEGVRSIDGVRIVGSPDVTVVAFASDRDGPEGGSLTYGIKDAVEERGWILNALQNPPALHLCLTLPTAPRAAEFVADLRHAVNEVTNDKTGKYSKGSTAGLYGSAVSVPASVVTECCSAFLDVLSESA